ncbi:MAG TPA: bifunctional 5,10-methylenetetrahydrofolate dehydrogenase/5,10-methenyltetrahydrofolate cyclohydrolase [Ktedonobacterales bacterium]|nr:bifunctional 5,10-methylenetetrahydrofolate dehydrogenase/5,10-methenyltetrahydrofolate cyclohydrolase [Ktedonobacterales bacterium]
MSAQILDGRALGAAIKAELKARASQRANELGWPPGLAIVRVGEEAASVFYTRQLLRVAAEIGIEARLALLESEHTADETLREEITRLNKDARIQGILIQMPLPPHLSQQTAANAIASTKDVDGISPRSAGNLFLGLPSFVPSTCAAVIEVLDRAGINPAGKRVVVVGYSNVVGKPLSFLLLQRNATVTICGKQTTDLGAMTRQGDILISAAGVAGLITAEMVKPGAAVIDVGINVKPEGGVMGDVNFEAVKEVAGAITPVPGGIGQLTNLMVMKQTIEFQYPQSGSS